jgi:hypothetical protein
MENIEAKQYVEFTYEGVIEKFYDGDKVICRTDENEYAGTIKAIGAFRETGDSEPVTVICIDTSKSVWSYSTEMIKVDDVTFICKDFLADVEISDDISDEDLQKNTYIGLLVGMGYERKKVENTWDKANNLMKQFNIPFEKTVSCILYSLKYKCNLETPLRLICGIDITGLEKSLPKFEKEAAKCLSMALIGGLVYLLADKLEKELTK